MDSLKRRWPALRGAILFLVIVLSVLKSVPIVVVTPEEVSERSETRFLARFMSHEQVASWTHAASETQRILILPVEWFYRAIHSGQRWNMFSGAAYVSYRMQVEARGPQMGDWEVLYREFDDEARFEADRIEYRRIRSAYSTFGGRAVLPYGGFVRWVAGRVFAERDDVQEVRARMRRIDRRPPHRRTGQNWRWGHGVRITREMYDADQVALRRLGSEIAQ